MGRKLGTFVHVDGVAYGPADDLPAEVAEKITAPHVWAAEVGDEPVVEPVTPSTVKPAARKPAPKD